MVQFWKIKEDIQDQNLEINMLKEEVQSLHDQHMDGKKLSKEKEQKKTVQKQARIMLTLHLLFGKHSVIHNYRMLCGGIFCSRCNNICFVCSVKSRQ